MLLDNDVTIRWEMEVCGPALFLLLRHSSRADRICRPPSLLLTSVRRVSAQVHKIDKIDLHGIRLRRTGGDIWLYKTLCTRLMEQMKL
jgi:hypothetical protein